MRNSAKMMYDEAAKRGFRPQAQDIRRQKESKFLDLE